MPLGLRADWVKEKEAKWELNIMKTWFLISSNFHRNWKRNIYSLTC